MYQVIARKYRPQSFEDVVNQDHVKQTLTNALSQGRVAHGYIFSGQRGTGKTTMARILAKCLNCERGPSADPCQKCSSCVEIAAGNALDLIEIDAASNRRIDDIRELRENVRYRPVRDRYKVFIIDEAHQITSDAFNALLKTLEEPPEWVVFILCTTEPHEIPATIVSRCQSFQFRAVELDQIVARMKSICEQEGVEADPDALISIAVAGDGSIRDSLSSLDQAIACFGKRLDAKPVRDLLGAIASEITDEIVGAIRDSNARAMLEIVDRVLGEGRHVQHFCGELARYFRNLLVMKISGADTRLVTIGPSEKNRISSYLEHFSQEDLTRYVQLLLELYRELQFATQPRFWLEVGLLKLVYAGHLESLEKILASWNPEDTTERGHSTQESPVGTGSAAGGRSKTKGPEASVKSAAAASVSASVSHQSALREQAPKSAALLSTKGADTEAATAACPDEALRQQLIAALQRGGDDHLADAIEHGRLFRTGDHLEIRSLADYRVSLEMDLETIRQALRRIQGDSVRVMLGSDFAESELEECVEGISSTSGTGSEAALAGGVSGDKSDRKNDVTERALADPEVQRFQELFSGQVREVRNLKEYSS